MNKECKHKNIEEGIILPDGRFTSWDGEPPQQYNPTTRCLDCGWYKVGGWEWQPPTPNMDGELDFEEWLNQEE